MNLDAELALVIELALETEDLAPAEQKALERLAGDLDKRRNRATSGNVRFDRLRTVPCTYTATHPASDRKAKAEGLPHACKCGGDLVMWPFTDRARAEALTDRHGWSRALDAVQEHGS